MGSCCSRQRKQSYEEIPSSEHILVDGVDENVITDGVLQPIERQRINEYLLTLYEKEIEFKRPSAEVECITNAVKDILQKIMTAVSDKNPLCEIAQQYLVGSMAEGTSIGEPDEFDFLVVLKQFSQQGYLRVDRKGNNEWMVNKNGICIEMCKSDVNALIWKSEKDKEEMLKLFLSKKISEGISSLPVQSFEIKTSNGKLSVQSTTVCQHGPAIVIKLLWQPSSETSKPLHILVDITPCIEQNGIDTVVNASEIAIPAHRNMLVKDDKYMLVPTENGRLLFAFTTSEIKIVSNLSAHHKLCYMILKYCLGGIIERYNTPFTSYLLKLFVLRHASRCSKTTHNQLTDCLYMCLVDIMDDIKRFYFLRELIDGIFGKYMFPRFYSCTIQIIDKIKRILEQGSTCKDGFSVSLYKEFRETCQRETIHPVIQRRSKYLAMENVECHLPLNCKTHKDI